MPVTELSLELTDTRLGVRITGKTRILTDTRYAGATMPRPGDSA
jgi:hypothetical protein